MSEFKLLGSFVNFVNKRLLLEEFYGYRTYIEQKRNN